MTNDSRRKSQATRRAARALACCALFTFAAASARAQGGQAGEPLDSLTTKGGVLSIVRVGEETDLQMELRLGRRKVTDLSGNMYASFVAHFREWGAGELVVMSLGSGGSACPAMFQLVVVGEKGLASVTEEFGDCSDSPTITLQRLPEEQLALRFPGYYRLAQAQEPGFRKPPPATWVYSKGVLREQKPPAPARRRGR
jgi:hypothetical protein